MEIINLKSEAYRNAARDTEPVISFGNRHFYISASAVRNFGLQGERKFIHFLIDVNRLYFYVNTNADGFTLFNATHADTLYGCFRTLHKVMLKQFPRVKFTQKYPIRRMATEYAGVPMYEVLLDHPIIKRKQKNGKK